MSASTFSTGPGLLHTTSTPTISISSSDFSASCLLSSVLHFQRIFGVWVLFFCISMGWLYDTTRFERSCAFGIDGATG